VIISSHLVLDNGYLLRDSWLDGGMPCPTLLVFDSCFTCVQERPIDVVVEGFIHLQQFHAKEIARGLAGFGGYRLRAGFPTITAMPQTTSFVVDPHDIVSTLQQPTPEVKMFITFFVIRRRRKMYTVPVNTSNKA